MTQSVEMTLLRQLMMRGLFSQLSRPAPEIDLALLAQVDWGQLHKLVHLHRLYQPVALGLADLDISAEKIREINTLCRIHQLATRRNLMETLRVMNVLKANGIPVSPLKGPINAHALYGSLDFRYSFDIDLLVPSDSLEAAAQILESDGYQSQFDWTSENPARSTAVKRTHVTFFNQEKETELELHVFVSATRHLMPSDFESDLWQAPSKHSLFGQQFTVFPASKRLVIDLVHGSKHAWSPLKLSLDVAAHLLTDQINWTSLVDWLSQHALQRPAALGFMFAERFLGIELPRPCADLILAEPIIEKLYDYTIAVQNLPAGTAELSKDFRYRWHFQDSWKYRRSLIFKRWHIQRNWIAPNIPSPLYPINKLLAPIPMILRATKTKR